MSDTLETTTTELAETNAVLESVLRNLPIGVLVEDTDREIVAVNPELCDVLEIEQEPSELVGRNCARVADELQGQFDDPERFRTRTETLLDRRDPAFHEELRLANGRTLERTYVPCSLSDGEANLWLYRDVTDRKERELERRNDRLEEFLSVLSHDLRNPLNVATANLEAAADASESDRLDAALDALDRMDLLIEDLLVLTREENAIGNTEPVHLGRLVRDCWTHVETDAATLDVDADRTVRADRSRLAQAFENLFRNAVEHGSTSHSEPAGSEDVVEHNSTGSRDGNRPDDAVEHGSTSPRSHAREDAVGHGSAEPFPTSRLEPTDPEDAADHGGQGVTIVVGTVSDGFYVEDDGRGVPPDERDSIFDATYSTSEDGTGLGLRIVETIVDAHGWEIDLAETSRDGARFEITGVTFLD